MRSSSCIIRCALDNMFRNSKQFSSSPSYAGGTSQGFGPSKEPTFGLQECMQDASLLPSETSNPRFLSKAEGYGDDPCSIISTHAVEDHNECALPKCMQFMDASDRMQHAQDAPNYAVTGYGAPRLADFEDGKRVQSLCGLASPKEIREYDFLRCIDEGSGAAPDEVDCTLHLGTASVTPSIRNRNAEVLKGMLDVAAASKHLISDNRTMPSFDSISRNVLLCQRDYGHLDKIEIKDNSGSMPWNSGSSAMSMWRAESVGMSRLLRENAHDIEECENSSRTSSTSSGTTIKTSAIVSDNPIMYTYSKSRDSDYSAAAAAAATFSSNRWFQYNDQGNFAGSVPNTKPIFGMRDNDRDSYLNPAGAILSAYAGPLAPHVFSGTKSSNAKEGANHVIRICAQCKTMRTPLWRNGPQGPKSLCNACGIRYKKEERRSAAVEDSKQQEADQRSRFNMDHPSEDQRSRFSMDPSDDQRPRSNMDDQRSIDPTDDQRSRFSNEDRRSRFSLGPRDEQRSRFIREDLSEDRRSRFSMHPCGDQRQRFIQSNLAIGDRRPRLVDDKKRPKLANDLYRPTEHEFK